MKRINTSTFSFPEIIEKDFLYVDKTGYIFKLLEGGKDEFFLSRPRRFGKSLLVSTLKAIFQGRRELFKGLAIDKMDYDWKTYPVIHLDFGAESVDDAENLARRLRRMLQMAAVANKVSLPDGPPEDMFEDLISMLAGKDGQVVVLVDEYDKPILSNVDNPEAPAILKVLKRFYSVIKTYEGKIRFAFITGVSKFAHVSMFSDLNNLTDITLLPEYACMLGFTEAEIREYFADRLPLAAKENGRTVEQMMADILQWYDGYRFSAAETHVCNPVSLSKFFASNYVFDNYWDDTGTPSFLVNRSRETGYDYEVALSGWYDKSVFSAYELDRLDITGLLWQTGYLTIKDVRQGIAGTRYRLDFPDREVRQTFMDRLLELYAGLPKGVSGSIVEAFYDAIWADDLDGLMRTFQSFLASIRYDLHIPNEKYYQTIFFIVFELLGIFIEAESCTNEGRIDACIRTAKAVYIFEFKLDKSAKKAIGQIIDRRYYEKFQSGELPIRLVGVSFDSAKGRIDGWKETTLADKAE